MALANCNECGKLYNKIISDYCPECNDKFDKYFNDINEFIYEHGPQPIHIVSNGTGIKERWIMKFINEGRLINCNIQYPCQQCGNLITKGKLCQSCIMEWNEHLKEKNDQNEAKQNHIHGKMYSSYSWKKGD
jgi:hypothetical protein